jgi:molybdopterin converting factor small subunit
MLPPTAQIGGSLPNESVMHIIIKFTSLFKVYCGVDQDEIDVVDGTTVDQLGQQLSKKYTNLPFESDQTLFFVNNKNAKRDCILADGDEVRIFQTLAGG